MVYGNSMIVLRLVLYQSMVNYRIENSFGHVQSYPLPTPSMIRGMAHDLLDLKEYFPLRISIQGNFESAVVNMQRVMKFDRDPKSRPNNPYLVEVGTSVKTATHSISFVDNLINCELILHIAFKNNEEYTKNLHQQVFQKTVVLGRNDDIARVDFNKTKLTEVKLGKSPERLKYSAYILKDIAHKNQIGGTHYKLPFKYEPVKDFNENRIFNFVECVYVSKDEQLEEGFYIDEDNLPVSFLELDNEF